MEVDAVMGCAVLAVALGTMLGLVWWSRGIIHRIEKKNLQSVRDIMKDLDNG